MTTSCVSDADTVATWRMGRAWFIRPRGGVPFQRVTDIVSDGPERSGVTVKAVRDHECLGLIQSARLPNGYRDYGEDRVRAVIEGCELAVAGITVRQAIPFPECLSLGHEQADDCASSFVAYRDVIAVIDRVIESLRDKRKELLHRLGYQGEVMERLRLPFTMLSGERLQGADVPDVPTFGAPGARRLSSRLTSVVSGGQIEHVFCPGSPPNTHAGQVLAWLREHP